MCDLTELLRTAGVSNVVWVDDCHGQKTDDQIEIEIHAKLAALAQMGGQPSHSALAPINMSAPEDVRSKQIDAVLAESRDILAGILEFLQVDVGDTAEAKDDAEDLSPEHVTALLQAFPNVTALSYAGWQKESESVLANCDAGTLFLIDREFSNEGQAADAGDEMVASIVSNKPTAHCIMLTHTVSVSDTESLRASVAEKTNGLERHQFGVMSKRELGRQSAEVHTRLADALKMAFLHRCCFDLAQRTSSVMKDALDSAARDLVGLSVEEIDRAIFQNSLEEGASEVDVVTRILHLRQRIAVQDDLAEATTLFERLSRLRAIRACPLLERGEDAGTKKQASPVHAWRIDEVFDPASRVNRIHSPLSCGDVFENTDSQQRYVLVVQPCDAAVRGAGNRIGKRRTEEGTFISVAEGEFPDELPERVFRIPAVGKNGESWVVFFQTAASVNLRVLDLAVFSSEGKVVWGEDQTEPKGLLPGWAKRYAKREKSIKPDAIPSAIEHLSLNPKITTIADCQRKGKMLSVPIQRVGRIRPPHADALLASYCAYVSRAAFDHNFARDLSAVEQEAESAVESSRQLGGEGESNNR